METFIEGNNLRVLLTKSEDNITVTLPTGYSYETLVVSGIVNINYFNPLCKAITGASYNFPPVNSKSPSTLKLLKTYKDTEASILLTISKFGQIPDSHYFDKPFDPILVTGEDGTKYNVIPSDQFN